MKMPTICCLCVRKVVKVMRDVVKIATALSIDGHPRGEGSGGKDVGSGESRWTENIWLQVEQGRRSEG